MEMSIGSKIKSKPDVNCFLELQVIQKRKSYLARFWGELLHVLEHSQPRQGGIEGIYHLKKLSLFCYALPVGF